MVHRRHSALSRKIGHPNTLYFIMAEIMVNVLCGVSWVTVCHWLWLFYCISWDYLLCCWNGTLKFIIFLLLCFCHGNSRSVWQTGDPLHAIHNINKQWAWNKLGWVDSMSDSSLQLWVEKLILHAGQLYRQFVMVLDTIDFLTDFWMDNIFGCWLRIGRVDSSCYWKKWDLPKPDLTSAEILIHPWSVLPGNF